MLSTAGQRAGMIRVAVTIPQARYKSSRMTGGIDDEFFRFGHAETALDRGEYKKERRSAREEGVYEEIWIGRYSIHQCRIGEVTHGGHEGRIIGQRRHKRDMAGQSRRNSVGNEACRRYQ